MIDHLAERMRKSFKVDPLGDGTPAEVIEGRGRRVARLGPEERPCLLHHPPHQIAIVPVQYLVLK